MNPAVLDKVSIDSTSADGQITLRANGQVIAFDGFLKLYQESFDDEEENDENRILPNVEPGEKETKGEIFTDQHFTAPPPRFTEASLVKKLEELGIGRPSCRNANTSRWKNCALSPKNADESSPRFLKISSTNTSNMTLPHRWKNSSTTFPPGKWNGASC